MQAQKDKRPRHPHPSDSNKASCWTLSADHEHAQEEGEKRDRSNRQASQLTERRLGVIAGGSVEPRSG